MPFNINPLLSERKKTMGLGQKILADRVICGEVFLIENIDEGIKIGNLAVPPGSSLSGTTEVTVMDCTPVIDMENDVFNCDITFFIQRELEIKFEDGRKVPFEYGFRVNRTVSFTNCRPNEISLTNPDLLRRLECRVIYILARDYMTLNPSDPPDAANASFDERLVIKLKLKLVQQRQLDIRICLDNMQTETYVLQECSH